MFDPRWLGYWPAGALDGFDGIEGGKLLSPHDSAGRFRFDLEARDFYYLALDSAANSALFDCASDKAEINITVSAASLDLVQHETTPQTRYIKRMSFDAHVALIEMRELLRDAT